MTFHSTACFPPTSNWKPGLGRKYGAKCGPSYGPGSGNTKFERTVGLGLSRSQSELSQGSGRPRVSGRRPKGLTRVNSEMGVTGWAPEDQPDYEKWCAFWKTEPVRPKDAPAPDLSSTEKLVQTITVDAEESNFRRDLHEDNHWRSIHANQKPEKLLRQQANTVVGNSPIRIEAQATIPKSKPQDFWDTGAIKKDETLMRNKNWCNLNRPKRLEPCGSPLSVWTPRVRPKTPLPVEIRQRGTGDVRRTVKIPAKEEINANNPRECQQVQLQAFGFKDPEHSFAVKDAAKSREYERWSDLYNDKVTHSRTAFDPKAKFVEPVTTSMELGWKAVDKETYMPICGDAPAKNDYINGLTRVSMAGGTSGRLCSPISKFIDNVLMTRPDFNAF